MLGPTLGALQSVYLWLSRKKCDKRHLGNRLSAIYALHGTRLPREAKISCLWGASRIVCEQSFVYRVLTSTEPYPLFCILSRGTHATEQSKSVSETCRRDGGRCKQSTYLGQYPHPDARLGDIPGPSAAGNQIAALAEGPTRGGIRYPG